MRRDTPASEPRPVKKPLHRAEAASGDAVDLLSRRKTLACDADLWSDVTRVSETGCSVISDSTIKLNELAEDVEQIANGFVISSCSNSFCLSETCSCASLVGQCEPRDCTAMSAQPRGVELQHLWCPSAPPMSVPKM